MKYCNRHIKCVGKPLELIHRILESTTFGQFILIIPHSYIATYLRGCFHLCLRSLPRPGPTCLSLASPCHIFASATPKRPLTQVPSEPFSYFAFSLLSLQNIKKSRPTFSAKVFNFFQMYSLTRGKDLSTETIFTISTPGWVPQT